MAFLTKTWFSWGPAEQLFQASVSCLHCFRVWGFAALLGAWQKTMGVLRCCGRSCLKSSKAPKQLAVVTLWVLSQGFSQFWPVLVLENKPHFHCDIWVNIWIYICQFSVFQPLILQGNISIYVFILSWRIGFPVLQPLLGKCAVFAVHCLVSCLSLMKPAKHFYQYSNLVLFP